MQRASVHEENHAFLTFHWFCKAFLMKHNRWRSKGGAGGSGRQVVD